MRWSIGTGGAGVLTAGFLVQASVKSAAMTSKTAEALRKVIHVLLPLSSIASLPILPRHCDAQIPDFYHSGGAGLRRNLDHPSRHRERQGLRRYRAGGYHQHFRAVRVEELLEQHPPGRRAVDLRSR